VEELTAIATSDRRDDGIDGRLVLEEPQMFPGPPSGTVNTLPFSAAAQTRKPATQPELHVDVDFLLGLIEPYIQ